MDKPVSDGELELSEGEKGNLWVRGATAQLLHLRSTQLNSVAKKEEKEKLRARDGNGMGFFNEE